MNSLGLIIFLAATITALGFQSPLKLPSLIKKSFPPEIALDPASAAKALATSLVATPLVAVADGGGASAVAIPVAISLLTLVPVIYYQQALKPKKRTAQQIPLDERLREIKPKDKKKGLW